jgi:hypothetical protein
MMHFALLAILYASAVESVIFTRWGRTVCPNGTSVIYTGWASGAPYDKQGGGSNYLCLPDNPEFNIDNVVPGWNWWASKIQGVQYEIHDDLNKDNKPFSFANNRGTSILNSNAPCVVCLRSNKNSVLTVPAKNKCPTDTMILEYNGYLTANAEDRFRNEFVCLDAAPETIAGSGDDTDGAWMSPVQIDCTAKNLPCPPYQDGYEVNCVVCTV